jgi:hypothetical protein
MIAIKLSNYICIGCSKSDPYRCNDRCRFGASVRIGNWWQKPLLINAASVNRCNRCGDRCSRIGRFASVHRSPLIGGPATDAALCGCILATVAKAAPCSWLGDYESTETRIARLRDHLVYGEGRDIGDRDPRMGSAGSGGRPPPEIARRAGQRADSSPPGSVSLRLAHEDMMSAEVQQRGSDQSIGQDFQSTHHPFGRGLKSQMKGTSPGPVAHAHAADLAKRKGSAA